MPHFPCVKVAAVLDVPGVEQGLCGECLAARELGAAKTAVPFFSQGQWRQPSPNHPTGYISLLGVPIVPELEISSSFTYLVLQKTRTRNKIFKGT